MNATVRDARMIEQPMIPCVLHFVSSLNLAAQGFRTYRTCRWVRRIQIRGLRPSEPPKMFFCSLRFAQTSLFQRFSWGKKLRIRAAASDSVMPGWFWAMMGVQKSIISCMVQSLVKAPF